MASGKNAKLSETATAKAQNIFGENLSDLGFGDANDEFQSFSTAGPSNLPEMGFRTARGSTATKPTRNMQKCAQILDDVQSHGCEEPMAKVIRPNCTQFNGFQFASGKNAKLSKTSEARVRDMFGEDLTDLGFEHANTHHQSFSIAGPSHSAEIGFKTAGGANIAITTANMQRYAKIMDEIDCDIPNETDVSCNENAVECKTPVAKPWHDRQTDAFMTSTPNPNVASNFNRLPPITPINKERELNELNSWLDEIGVDKVFSTQSQTHDDSHQNQSLNNTIGNELQYSINGSITENDTDVIRVSDAVKSARKVALSEQQIECFKKPYSICPLIGWLYLKKMVNSMQFHELDTPKSYKRNELEHFGVQANVIDVNVNNALQFKFDMWNFYSMEICQTNVNGIDMHDDMRLIMDANARCGVREITSALLQCPTVDPKLIPDHWITNHLKWIIVKLASYERTFPNQFSGCSLTPENVGHFEAFHCK